MRIDTTVTAVQLPSIFRNLFTIAPWEWWQRREKELKGREEKNPYLTAYFDENFSLERALFQAIKYRKATTRYPSISGAASIGYYQLYSFTHAIVNTHAHLSSRGQTRLRGSLKDGLNSEYGLTPVALEMAVAVHLWSTGFDVDFTDMEGRGQFDFLANREGIELEVDCKTASGDVGRSIHRYRMLELLKLCQPAIDECLARGGGTIIRITLPGALHGREDYMKDVAALAIAATKPGKDLDAVGVANIKMTTFQMDKGPFQHNRRPTQAELIDFVPRSPNGHAPHVMSVHRPHEVAVVVIVESQRPDKVLQGIYRSLKDSAARQFTRTRPALLALRLIDLTHTQLLELAVQQEHGLSAIANRLFAGPERQHLYGLVIMSPSQSLDVNPPTKLQPEIIQDRWSALLYRNHKHPLAADPRLNVIKLFGQAAIPSR